MNPKIDRMESYQNFSAYSKNLQKEIVSQSGYSLAQMLEEDPVFIANYDFEDYARESAYDDGLITDENDNWPLNCIDWEEAVRQLKFDYSEIEIDNQSYWFRSW